MSLNVILVLIDSINRNLLLPLRRRRVPDAEHPGVCRSELAFRQPFRRQPALHAGPARDFRRPDQHAMASVGSAGAFRSSSASPAGEGRLQHGDHDGPLPLLGRDRERLCPELPEFRVRSRSRDRLLEAAAAGRRSARLGPKHREVAPRLGASLLLQRGGFQGRDRLFSRQGDDRRQRLADGEQAVQPVSFCKSRVSTSTNRSTRRSPMRRSTATARRGTASRCGRPTRTPRPRRSFWRRRHPKSWPTSARSTARS